jgi:hypothetical protein
MGHALRLLLAGMLASLALHTSASDQGVALVKSVAGEVVISRDGASRAATQGAHLGVSDRIVAADGATIAIAFRDGTLLTLGSGADILVRDYVFEPKDGNYAFSLYMARGAAIYESGKIGKLAPDAVRVETPKATVGVRGTRFLIEAD